MAAGGMGGYLDKAIEESHEALSSWFRAGAAFRPFLSTVHAAPYCGPGRSRKGTPMWSFATPMDLCGMP